jgi:hypothetical protein
MQGRIKLGSWRPFHARQVLAPTAGYVGAASTRFHGLPVVGYDRYIRTGEMRWLLCGMLPVVRETGAEVTLSAASVTWH